VLLAAEPRVYYVTDHYLNYPSVLVRLPRIDRSSLRDLLEMAWSFVSSKTKGGQPPRGKETALRGKGTKASKKGS
jgi:hypothetical protein